MRIKDVTDFLKLKIEIEFRVWILVFTLLPTPI